MQYQTIVEMKINQFQKVKLLSLSLLMGLMIVSCKSDDPEPVNPEELITTINVTFTNTNDANDVVSGTFKDLDGDGGNAPTITHPTLRANAIYTVSIQFLNEQENPAENVTTEIQGEDEEHQIFYVSSGGLNLTYAYTDQDGDGNPLGLAGTAATGAASTGNLVVSLVHEPVKTATGVAEGNPTNAGGETEAEVTFNVTIQ